MRAVMSVFVLLALSLVGCGREALIKNPEPIAGGGSIEATEQAILDTLPKRRWSVETMEPGHVVAFLALRSHLLRVDILYDAQSVNIRYRDSDNLNERPSRGGQLTAHRNVNRWMAQLAKDIDAELAKPRTSGGPYTRNPAPAQAAPAEPAPDQPAPPPPSAVREQIQGAPPPQ